MTPISAVSAFTMRVTLTGRARPGPRRVDRRGPGGTCGVRAASGGRAAARRRRGSRGGGRGRPGGRVGRLGGRRGRRAARRGAAAVVPVETGSLEDDADSREHLLEASLAVRAHGQGIIGELLHRFEALAALGALVLIGRHLLLLALSLSEC